MTEQLKTSVRAECVEMVYSVNILCIIFFCVLMLNACCFATIDKKIFINMKIVI